MLLETYDIGLEARTLHLIAGLVLGLIFGISAQVSRFCFRRAVAGVPEERTSAATTWAIALLAATTAFAALSSLGFIDLSGHRYLSSDLPLVGLILGGLAFGVGMVLTRGCISRLTVLSATGNLRALTVLLVLAVTIHATLKGVLAPLRVWINGFTVDLPLGTVTDLPGGAFLLVAPIAVGAALLIRRARPSLTHLALGVLIGLVAAAGWAATSILLMDEFDPLPVQTAAFTSPWSDTLFWVIASSAVPAGFGVGFIGGVLGGSFLSAAARGELALQSFETPAQSLRYGLGGVLMGAGGAIAGGCTIGAGLSGVATGSVAAIIVLASIAVGGWIMGDALRQSRAAPATA
ncbi:MAG: YeeE/YedE family protein [Pseudomonadota bacterium]